MHDVIFSLETQLHRYHTLVQSAEYFVLVRDDFADFGQIDHWDQRQPPFLQFLELLHDVYQAGYILD